MRCVSNSSKPARVFYRQTVTVSERAVYTDSVEQLLQDDGSLARVDEVEIEEALKHVRPRALPHRCNHHLTPSPTSTATAHQAHSTIPLPLASVIVSRRMNWILLKIHVHILHILHVDTCTCIIKCTCM